MFSRLIQQRARQFVAAIVRPLARLGITPNMVTLLGLLLSVVTAVVIASGYVVAGGALVLFAGIFDMFDGAMARVRNAATTFGAFLDSTLDRYSESIILGGLLYYALQRSGLHEILWPFANEQEWMIALIFVATVGSLMVSYAKARAEGLGLECKTGLLARPERVVILAIGLLTGTTIWALTLLAILSHVTAIERIMHVWRATNQLAANTHVKPLSADGLAQTPGSNGLDHRLSDESNETREPPVSSVPTSLPPLTGSVPQD
jgi:CDP-diacylglycerol---glycerol-3-phosphate 3-phosphatidyltransferase